MTGNVLPLISTSYLPHTQCTHQQVHGMHAHGRVRACALSEALVSYDSITSWHAAPTSHSLASIPAAAMPAYVDSRTASVSVSNCGSCQVTSRHVKSKPKRLSERVELRSSQLKSRHVTSAHATPRHVMCTQIKAIQLRVQSSPVQSSPVKPSHLRVKVDGPSRIDDPAIDVRPKVDLAHVAVLQDGLVARVWCPVRGDVVE